MHGWNLHFRTRVYFSLSVYKERDRQDISSQLLFFSSNLSLIDRYPLSCTFEQCSAFKPSHVSTTYLVRVGHFRARLVDYRLSLPLLVVIRSSTDIVQNVYAKAKDTSALIRVPCSVAEVVADKSLKIALTIANPFFMPFRRPGNLSLSRTLQIV